uniref:Uncharacterized protein n=1 Tax=Oryza rufipogon TaxID=4529 RepID=A0A0E0Q8L6_ORYRU
MPDWGLPPAGLAYLLLVAGYGSMATTSRRRRRQRRSEPYSQITLPLMKNGDEEQEEELQAKSAI